MEENNESVKRSKEEMARRISGSVSARMSDEILSRQESRRRAEEYDAFRRSPVNNPYMRSPGAPSPSRSSSGSKKKRLTAAQKAKRRAAKEAKLKRQKQQRRRRIISACITLAVMLTIVGIGGFTWYTRGKATYDGVFLDNTFINGVTVSRQTPKEAAKLVRQNSDMPDFIVLTRPDGIDVKISLVSLNAKDNVDAQVKELYNSQSHNNWFKAKNAKTEYNFPVKFDFDREKLYKEVKAKIVDGEKTQEPENAYIVRSTDGFKIVPEVVGTSIDADKVQMLYDYIDAFLDRAAYTIDLKNCNCYKMPDVTSADLSEQLATLDRLFDARFTFDFGYTKEVLKGSTTFDWLIFKDDDPSNGYTVDEDKVEAYIEKLSNKYDTYGKDRKFRSTSRGDILVKQGRGGYGWWIDQDKTAKLLTDLIKDGISGKVKPYYYEDPVSGFSYTGDPSLRTKDGDLGNTYCEVDLEKQHFWYYENGQKMYDCDIVSGKPTETRNTPEGVYKLWYKQKDKVLSGSTEDGETWTTPVTYW
ncbi:MAG: L,D-transpeptidase/peptidoglycan binding protein, partial [Ruminococcus sp.]|nr:L,D-transpeptidase/peptidoglycan binding protein [Ruminococcus sp.]